MRRIAFWLKVAYTAFVVALVPIYRRQYGWRNFLWFSDIALFMTLPALWLERPLLASMPAVSVLVPEAAWTIDFAIQGLFGIRVIGLADYMFDSKIPRPVRALSFFHLWLPLLLLWTVRRLGYDRRALLSQTVLTWLVLAATYRFTTPSDNINWVYGFRGTPQRDIEPRAYLLLVMAIYPIAFHWPAHALLKRVAPRAAITSI